MPSNKWVLIAIGIALGMFVIPMVLSFAGGAVSNVSSNQGN